MINFMDLDLKGDIDPALVRRVPCCWSCAFAVGYEYKWCEKHDLHHVDNDMVCDEYKADE